MEVPIYFEHHLEGMGTINRKDFSFRLKSFKGIYVTVLTCCCGEPAETFLVAGWEVDLTSIYHIPIYLRETNQE